MRARRLVALFVLLLAGLALFLPPAPAEAYLVCAWASEKPCPTAGDCGYDFDGICCRPRCPRPIVCPSFCYFEPV